MTRIDLDLNSALASPDPNSNAAKQELIKERYSRQLDAWLAVWKQDAADEAVRVALVASREDADNAAEVASLKAIESAYIATTQSSLDRALTRMNVVTASVGAITTVYTALLALVFAAEPNKGEKLPLVALVPAMFLGLSLFLVTIYAAMFRKSIAVGPLLPTGIGGQIAELRLVTFMRWCFAGVLARSWALNAGVVSLGIGIATLPLPFIKTDATFDVVVFLAGLAVVTITALVSAGFWKDSKLFKWIRSHLPTP
jgi:hypothetical protein